MPKRTNPITDMPEGPKHHEKQQLADVERIRQRVIGHVKRLLFDIRGNMAARGGNERLVEMLRGRELHSIIGRVSTTVMMELGDTSTAQRPAGISRAISELMGSRTPRRDLDAVVDAETATGSVSAQEAATEDAEAAAGAAA